MKKIEKLTPEQEAKFPEYVKKWSSIGCNTDRLDVEETTRIANNFQEFILKRKKTPVVILDNPNECWVACNYAMNGVAPEDLRQRVHKFFDTPKAERDIEVGTPVFPYQDGSFFASVFSFYDYMFNEFDIEIDQELRKLYNMWEETSKIGLIYPLENVCIISQKPTVIKLNSDNQLHCDGDAALEYAGKGNFKIYSLNGVIVDEYLAVTSSGKLSLDYYNELKNADQKTEFVRKYGVDRMLSLGKRIDSYENYNEEWWNKSQYELWDMSSLFPSIDYAPHLKMLNQTVEGIYHLEAVSPKCSNLREAIQERLGGRDLTIKKIA